MDTDSLQQQESWLITDVVRLTLSTVKNNFAAVLCIIIVYGGIFAAINIAFMQSKGLAFLFQALLSVGVTMSLVSVLRPAFENGKMKIRGVLPGSRFAEKVILYIVFLIGIILILKFVMGLITVFCGYFLSAIFGRLLKSNTAYLVFGLGTLVSLLFAAYCSLCMVSFSSKNGFYESLSDALKIFTENGFLSFFVFAAAAAGLTYLISAYTPVFGSSGAFKLKQLALFVSEYSTVKTVAISSFIMPVYWFLTMSVYFSLCHEGSVKKVIESRMHYGQYYSPYAETGEPEEKPNDENKFESFSLLNAVYFSWGIYKKLFAKLTFGYIAVFLFFLAVCGAVFFILRQTDIVSSVFSPALSDARDIFILSAAAFVIYYFIMFFYVSYVRGFFRGKGLEIKNFFPSLAAVLRFVTFLFFIGAFFLSIPFIIDKVNVIMQLEIRSFTFPFSAVTAGCSFLFAVIIAYAAVSLFYVPLFLLDGHRFFDALNTCTDMMKGQKMGFFCILAALFALNLIGHATVVGWLFTAPFTVLVIIQIYSTISVGYSKYHEDVTDYA